MEEEIRRKVDENEQQCVITIEDMPKERQQNINVLTKEEIKNEAFIKTTSDTPLPCINPVLIKKS